MHSFMCPLFPFDLLATHSETLANWLETQLRPVLQVNCQTFFFCYHLGVQVKNRDLRESSKD